MLRWQDVFRPLVEASPPLRAHTLVRWFDNNAFYRAPEVGGGIAPLTRVEAILPDPMVPRPRVATLPSPYLFSRAAIGVADRNAFMIEVAGAILRPAIEQLGRNDCELIHLQEPWLPYFGIGAADWAPFQEALGLLHGTTPLVLFLPYGDAGPHVDRLRRLPVDAIGIDLVETDVAELGGGWEIGLAAGCVNGRSSLIESLDDTVDLIHHVARSVKPARLFVTANSDLELLPTAIAEQKVRLLGEVAKHVRAKVPA